VSKEQEKEIIKLYNSGISSPKIVNILNFTKRTILNILKRNGIERRTNIRNKKYEFNENYFEKIDSNEKAYFLGLIVSDGNIFKNTITISLQEGDQYILKYFMQKLLHEGKIYNIKDNRKDSYKNKRVLRLYSQQMGKDLAKYGVIEAKSHKSYFPDIPEKFYSHFIRGVFDGDGSICCNNKTIKFSITGNIDLIQKIQEILIKECNLNKTKLYNSPKHPKNIVTMQNHIARIYYNLYNYLYKNSDNIYLKRKKEKFEQWI